MADSVPALAAAVVKGELVPEAWARTGRLARIVRRAIHRDPAQRFPSMEALIVALERARVRRWPLVVISATVALAGAAVMLRENRPADACDPGTAVVQALWGAGDRAAVRVGGPDYTERYAHAARERLLVGIDDYAAGWASAYDASCAKIGRAGQRGSATDRHTAQCVENRLDSLRGMVELAIREPLDAGDVDALLGTLPRVESCVDGNWVPYPAAPADAAKAAELHRTYERIHRAMLMGDSALVRDDAAQAVQAARALGEPYLLAQALTQQARVGEPGPAADALLREALQLAVGSGHDLLGAHVVNAVLLTSADASPPGSWRDIAYAAALARGLIERSGGDDQLLGNIALNEGNLARFDGHYEDAVALEEQALVHFRRAGDRQGTANAAFNLAVSIHDLHGFRTALPQLVAATEELERAGGPASRTSMAALRTLVGAFTQAGLGREAFDVATRARLRANEYTETSEIFQLALWTYAAAAVSVGELELGRQALRELRALEPPAALRLRADLVALQLLQLDDRHAEALQQIPGLQARLDGRDGLRNRAVLDLQGALSLCVIGQWAAARSVLERPDVQGSLLAPDAGALNRASTIVLAALAKDTPPPRLRRRATRAVGRRDHPLVGVMIDAADAVRGPGDPTVALQSLRQALVAAYGEHEVLAQVIDAWLTGPGRERVLPAPEPGVDVR